MSEFAAWLLRQEDWSQESAEDAAAQFLGEANSSSPVSWTRVAPTAPGYYWGRESDGHRDLYELRDGEWLSGGLLAGVEDVEWWPILVEPPR